MRRTETGDHMQRALVERAQSGDHEAFSVLVRTSYPRLHGVANLVLRDRDRAQDAVQDALVLAWRNIRALRDADAWDAWLYRLTLRACNRAARTSRRRDVVGCTWSPTVTRSSRRTSHGSCPTERSWQRRWIAAVRRRHRRSL